METKSISLEYIIDQLDRKEIDKCTGKKMINIAQTHERAMLRDFSCSEIF